MSHATSARADLDRYDLKIYTGNRRGASSVADVELELCRKSVPVATARTGPYTDFERGTVAKMSISGDRVEDIDTVVVRHRIPAGEPSSDWLMERLVVRRRRDGKRWDFPCGFWMQTGPEETSERVLFAAKHAQAHTPLDEALAAPPLLARPLRLLAAGVCRPHPDKEVRGAAGEDAWYVEDVPVDADLAETGRGEAGTGERAVCDDDAQCDPLEEAEAETLRGAHAVHGTDADLGATRLFSLGVADGVADWALKGVDAGEYSRALMQFARTAFRNGHTDPVSVMTAAWSGVQQQNIDGSSTMTVVNVDGTTGVLHAANLGDSGFLICRGGRVYLRSPELEHSFGHPYQLSSLERGDTPAHAQVTRVTLAKGDVLVVATDGLFDNLDPDFIADAVWTGRFVGVTQLAQYLVNEAHKNSTSKTVDTPWAKAARDEFNLAYGGGKKDDTTVIVAKVVDA